ncbi:MAG TPA: tetratricopeptide repeat protein [Polyangiaceae bacterium]|nr:tetratricopeptide repeat protein [Polyangiaceae bacterium]
MKTASGQQFTFLTLRELQRAILAHQVSRTDLLRRAGAPPRSLGSISELEPFFEGRTSSSRPPPRNSSAAFAPAQIPPQDGPPAFPKRPSVNWEDDVPTGRPVQAQAQPAPQPPPEPPQRGTAAYGQAPSPPPAAARPKIDTLRPPDSAPPAPALTHGPAAPAPRHEPPPPPPPRRATAPLPGNAYTPTPPTAAPVPVAREGRAAASPLPPPTRPVRRVEPSGADDDDLPEMRSATPSSSVEEPYSIRRGRRVGGWVVALVLLGAVGVLGWALARPYLVANATPAASQLDPRAEGFLATGEKAMAEGNLDQAQEALDKASALAENDPRVRLDQARVAAAQADVPWLKLKVLPPTAADDVRTTSAELSERVGRATRLADAAYTSAPDSPAAARAKLDALRLGGQQGAARALVTKIIAQASQPETAYVLAALDLAEPEPLWPTLLDRLRLAASGEGNAGRARAALVYALVRSGDGAGARAELAKLDGLPRPYPLSPSLHALVDRSPTKSPDAGAPEPRAAVAAAASPAPAGQGAAAAAAAPQVGGGGGGGEAVPNDNRSAMQLATAAYKKGDFDRARQIYEAIATRNPGDSEAVAALGDVARAQGDLKTAIMNYKRAIGVNPSYLPALLGLADTEWAAGDRTSAAKAYGDISDRFPEGTYPSYVKQRVESAAPPQDTPKPADAPRPTDVPKPPPAPAATGTVDELGP